MLVLFFTAYRIRGPSLHKPLEMVLGISMTGPSGVLTKPVCCRRPELRILGLFGVLGLRELNGSGQAAQVPSLHV